MCLNPRLLLCKKVLYKGYEKTVIFWNTSFEEYSQGYAIINRSDISRVGRKTLEQLNRYGLIGYYQNDFITITGEPLVFDTRIELPCRTCLECTRSRANEWSIRCELESRLYKDNYFVTLTYNDKFLPKNHYLYYDVDNDMYKRGVTPTLHKPHCTAFMKSLRQNYKRTYFHDNIRFFMAGEYGTKSGRPHYHYILFNLPIYDLELIGKSKNGFPLYRSRFLEKSWKYGFVTIQKYTIETARYTAQYCCKKLNKKQSVRFNKEMEFINMSRRRGIGFQWFMENFDKKIRFKDGFVFDKINFSTINNGEIKKTAFSMPKAFTRYFFPVTDLKRCIDTDDGLMYGFLNCDNDDIYSLLVFQKYLNSVNAEKMLKIKMQEYGYNYEKDRFSEKYLDYLSDVRKVYNRKFKINREFC